MFKNMTLGQYFPGNSPIHRLDPRTKLLATVAYIVLIFLVKTFWGYLGVLAFLGVVVALSGVRFGYVVKGLKPLLFIILFTMVINAFFTSSGTVYWQWKFLSLSSGGILLAVHMALRLTFLVLGTQLLTLTTPPLMLTDAIESLLKPLKAIKLPVHELAMMMSIALRFIPTLMEETDKLMKAQASRGADFESGNLFRRAKNMVPLLVPLFVSAFRRADELALAMEARCYRGGEGRTRLKVLRFTRLDAYALIAMLVFTAFLLVDFFVLGK
ncbi:MAG: energy-coupling factor transporter transmembrane component T [Eubacteriales bacterium]|nr:energy-coupling factor transporter transmembrane component T [Eubacteriales bacterium]